MADLLRPTIDDAEADRNRVAGLLRFAIDLADAAERVELVDLLRLAIDLVDDAECMERTDRIDAVDGSVCTVPLRLLAECEARSRWGRRSTPRCDTALNTPHLLECGDASAAKGAASRLRLVAPFLLATPVLLAVLAARRSGRISDAAPACCCFCFWKARCRASSCALSSSSPRPWVTALRLAPLA